MTGGSATAGHPRSQPPRTLSATGVCPATSSLQPSRTTGVPRAQGSASRPPSLVTNTSPLCLAHSPPALQAPEGRLICSLKTPGGLLSTTWSLRWRRSEGVPPVFWGWTYSIRRNWRASPIVKQRRYEMQNVCSSILNWCKYEITTETSFYCRSNPIPKPYISKNLGKRYPYQSGSLLRDRAQVMFSISTYINLWTYGKCFFVHTFVNIYIHIPLYFV